MEVSGQVVEGPAQQIVLQEYINTVKDCTGRIARLTSQIQEVLPSWELAPVVKALQAKRGVSLQVAVTTVAELGNLKRFDNPRKLMSYLGVNPRHIYGTDISLIPAFRPRQLHDRSQVMR